jgi:hypothetical protein
MLWNLPRSGKFTWPHYDKLKASIVEKALYVLLAMPKFTFCCPHGVAKLCIYHHDKIEKAPSKFKPILDHLINT